MIEKQFENKIKAMLHNEIKDSFQIFKLSNNLNTNNVFLLKNQVGDNSILKLYSKKDYSNN